MSFDENSPAFRRQSIYLFFKLGFEVHDSVKLLSNGFSDVTFKEVDAWFARFRTGSRDLDTDVVIDNDARGLESMPVNLKRKIMESVNVDDQRALLKTDQCFRKILKADRRIYEEVKIDYTPNSLNLSLTNEITGIESVRFEKREDGCEKKTKGKETTTLPGYYIDEGIQKFKEAIEKPGTKIRIMSILFDCSEYSNETEQETIASEVRRTMSGLKEKVHVETLKIQLFEKEDLYHVLCGMKVGALTNLVLNGRRDLKFGVDDVRSFGAHFSHLNDLLTFVRMGPRIIANIPSVVKFFHGFCPEGMKTYREKILESTRFRHHILRGDFDRDVVRAALEPYTVDQFEKYEGLLTAPGKQPIKFSIEESKVEFERNE